jgi:hypothetical protein
MKSFLILIAIIFVQSTQAQDVSDIKSRILGNGVEVGLGFQFGEEHLNNSVDNKDNLDVSVGLASEAASTVNEVFSELKKEHYPVSLKHKTITFSWTQYYCSHYDNPIPDEFAYLTRYVVKKAMERIASNLYENCPIMEDLGYDLQEKIFGKELVRRDHRIEYQSELEKSNITFHEIEDIHRRLNQIAQNRCDLDFKNTTSKLQGLILGFNPDQLTIRYQNSTKKKSPEYSFQRFCSKPERKLASQSR